MSSQSLHPAPRPTVDRIQANLITHYRMFAGLPGVSFTETDITWSIDTQGIPGNQILHTQVPDAEIDQRIDELLREIGQIASQVDWFVFPSCQPADLGERLAARGQAGGPDGAWRLIGKIGGPGGNWMLTDLTALASAPAVATNFHVESVDNPHMLDQWRQISAAGFGGGDFQTFYAAYARHGFGKDACSLHHIGYLDDTPVTSSTLLLADGIAGLFDISTPPAWRRQGFGSAISWAMLQAAQTRGYRDAYVWSSALGKGVYAGIGFVAADIGMREYQWQKR